jgi:hypothetical protein
MAASFNNLIPSVRLKDHMDEELFRYLPERNWPPTFLDFISTLGAFLFFFVEMLTLKMVCR